MATVFLTTLWKQPVIYPPKLKIALPKQEEGPPRHDVAASPVERRSRRPLGDSGSLYIIIIKNSIINVIWVCPFICELDVVQSTGSMKKKTELLWKLTMKTEYRHASKSFQVHERYLQRLLVVLYSNLDNSILLELSDKKLMGTKSRGNFPVELGLEDYSDKNKNTKGYQYYWFIDGFADWFTDLFVKDTRHILYARHHSTDFSMSIHFNLKTTLLSIWGLPRWHSGKKNLPANLEGKRNSSSIPGLGRSPGGESGNPLQYSCLENSMDRGAWWAIVHGVAVGYILSTHVLLSI